MVFYSPQSQTVTSTKTKKLYQNNISPNTPESFHFFFLLLFSLHAYRNQIPSIFFFFLSFSSFFFFTLRDTIFFLLSFFFFSLSCNRMAMESFFLFFCFSSSSFSRELSSHAIFQCRVIFFQPYRVIKSLKG